MADDKRVDVKVGVDQSSVSAGLNAVVDRVKSAVAAMVSSLTGLGAASSTTSEKVIADNAKTAVSFEALKDKVTGAHAEMTAGLNKVNVAIASFLAILGGGSALGHFITENNERIASIVKLGQMFGVNSDKATTFATALHSIGMTNEQAEQAFRKFEMQIKRNSDGLQKLGVDTVGLKNGTKSAMDGFLDAIKIVGKYEEGQDQMQIAMQLLGTRGAADIQKFLRLVKVDMEEMEKKQRSLGLTVTEESRKMSRAYNEGMADVHLVFDAIGKVIAEHLMPRLIALATWFSEEGPTAVQITRDVLATVSIVMHAVGSVAKALWEIIRSSFSAIGTIINSIFGTSGSGITALEFFGNVLKVIAIIVIWAKTVILLALEAIDAAIEVTASWFRRIGEVASAALKLMAGGKWSDVTDAWQRSSKDIENVALKHWENMKKIAADGATEAAAAAAPGSVGGTAAPGTIIPHKTGLKAPDFGKHKKEKDDRMELWREELQEKIQAQGFFFENSKKMEVEFWEEKLKLTTAGSEADRKIRAQINQLIWRDRKALAHEELAVDLKKLQDEITAAEHNKDKQIKLAEERAALVGEKYKYEGVKYQEMLDKILALKKAWVKKEQAVEKTRDDAMIAHYGHQLELDKQYADQLLALGQITNATRLAMEETFENRMYAKKLAALQKERAARADDIQFVAQMDAKIEALEDAHQAALTKLSNQGVLDREKYALEANKAIESSFSTLLSDLAQRTKTLKQSFLDFFKSISDALTKIAANKIAEKWLGSGSQGGDFLSGITSKIFGGGATGAASALGGGTKAADTAAETAHTTAVTADTATVTLDTAAKTALTTVTELVVTSFTALVAGANAAAAAMTAMAASGGGGAGGGIGALFGEGGGGIGSFIGLASGTPYVPQDSLYFLHKGERVTPAKYNNTTSTTRGGVNQSIVTNFAITGPVDTRTMDQIASVTTALHRRAAIRGS